MPMYEYNCQGCYESFEELVRGDEEIRCPACGTSSVTRKMSTCGFISSSKFVGSAGSSCGGCSSHSCSGCACGK